MKRNKLLKYLRNNNCSLLREGGNHSMYVNNITDRQAPVPRHPEIEKRTITTICAQLGIEKPAGD
jgi:predicted RNA binding protein YcfA (HicA-like mRNA interferase family)